MLGSNFLGEVERNQPSLPPSVKHTRVSPQFGWCEMVTFLVWLVSILVTMVLDKLVRDSNVIMWTQQDTLLVFGGGAPKDTKVLGLSQTFLLVMSLERTCVAAASTLL